MHAYDIPHTGGGMSSAMPKGSGALAGASALATSKSTS